MAEVSTETQETGALGFWHRYRALIIMAAIAVALLGWLYVSKGIAVRNVEEAAADQRAELLKQVAARHAETVKQSLVMFSTPFAWAIRREMMANNLDQVDQYVTDLVKLKGFEQVVVAKADGSIAVASDRKNLGTAFSSLYPERYLSLEQISTEETAPGRWQIAIPVMGLNAKFGTIAIDYQAAPSMPNGQP